MSTLYVDNLQPNLGSQVEIPNLKPNSGTVIQYKAVEDDTSTTLAPNSGKFTVVSLSFTPKSPDSLIRVTWSHGQTRKVSGAGTGSWLSGGVDIDGTSYTNLGIGALGYPEAYADHRYMPSKTGYTSSWSGTKTVAHWVLVGSTGSNWVVNHQGYFTHLEVMEIAQ